MSQAPDICPQCGWSGQVCDCSNDDDPDELEESMSNCSGFFDGEYFVCGAAGSEDCDWDCPFSRDLGLTAKQIEERDEKEPAP